MIALTCIPLQREKRKISSLSVQMPLHKRSSQHHNLVDAEVNQAVGEVVGVVEGAEEALAGEVDSVEDQRCRQWA